MNKNIYIAGKITGLKNYKKLFNKAENNLNLSGFNCMNPSVFNEGFEQNEYMHVCYAMIDICDTIYMLNNWKDSIGARSEYNYASRNGKKILFQEVI